MERVIIPKSADDDAPQTRSAALVTGRPARHLSEAFDVVIAGPSFIGIPPALEMFVAPGLLTAVMVHSPIGETHSLPVPLGIISFDERVVQRAQERLMGCLPQYLDVSGKLPTEDPRSFVEETLRLTPSAVDGGRKPPV
jgi:hypothetical protein